MATVTEILSTTPPTPWFLQKTAGSAGSPVPPSHGEYLEFEKYRNPFDSIFKFYGISDRIHTLNTRHGVPVDNEVLNYFLSRDFLLPFVEQTIEKVREYFGSEVQDFGLEIFYDPEDEDSQGELFLTVYTSLDVKHALEILEKFDKEWFIPNSRGYLGYFNVDLEKHVSME